MLTPIWWCPPGVQQPTNLDYRYFYTDIYMSPINWNISKYYYKCSHSLLTEGNSKRVYFTKQVNIPKTYSRTFTTYKNHNKLLSDTT
jgi:hypothetical protein